MGAVNSESSNTATGTQCYVRFGIEFNAIHLIIAAILFNFIIEMLVPK